MTRSATIRDAREWHHLCVTLAANLDEEPGHNTHEDCDRYSCEHLLGYARRCEQTKEHDATEDRQQSSHSTGPWRMSKPCACRELATKGPMCHNQCDKPYEKHGQGNEPRRVKDDH
jgi:hypothetical protein